MAGSKENEDAALCLSDLPDEILIRILSFLPTKSAVATNLLSRRWQYLWTFTPNLELHELQHGSMFDGRDDQIINFAERALLLRGGSPLVSFSLSCTVEKEYASRLNTLISSAIRYNNVEQLSLDLSVHGGKSLLLPFCMFVSHSLVKLDLNMEFLSTVRVPSMVNLPSLKHLALKWVAFVDNESTEKLLSHPLLEELIIYKCTWGAVSAVNVNSPMLQSLTIYDRDEDDSLEERQVCFFGDNSKFFSYDSVLWPTQYCICGSTKQLREAEIAVLVPDHDFQVMDGPSNRFCKLINQLSMVQNLTLTDDTILSFYLLSKHPWRRTTLPVFEHVTQLNLHDPWGDDQVINIESKELKMLYNRCPHLEHLNFKDEITLYHHQSRITPILTPMPACFRTHLKKVTLQYYEPESDYYQDPILLLFYSAPVLEEVVIHQKRGLYGQVSIVEELEHELNSRRKVSENCKVSVVLV